MLLDIEFLGFILKGLDYVDWAFKVVRNMLNWPCYDGSICIQQLLNMRNELNVALGLTHLQYNVQH
jgi:hypothetical protein